MNKIRKLWTRGCLGKVVVLGMFCMGLLVSCMIMTMFLPSPENTPGAATVTTTKKLPTATTTLTAETTICRAVSAALSQSNRGLRRLPFCERDVDNHIVIRWTINDNLTENMIKTGAQLDLVRVLKAVAKSGQPFISVYAEGSFAMVDQYGAKTETIVVRAFFERATVDKINFDNFNADNIYVIADSGNVHRAFQN